MQIVYKIMNILTKIINGNCDEKSIEIVIRKIMKL